MPQPTNQGKQWDGASERVGQSFFFWALVDGSNRVTIPATIRTLADIGIGDYARVHVQKFSAYRAGLTDGDTDDHIVAAKARRHVDDA